VFWLLVTLYSWHYRVKTLAFLLWLLIFPQAMKFSFVRSFLLSIVPCFFSIIKMENGPSPSHFPSEGIHSICRLSTPIWEWWLDDGLRASSFDCYCLGFFRHRLWPDDGSIVGSLSVCQPFLFTIFRCLKYSNAFQILCTIGLSVHALHSCTFITLLFYCNN